MTTNPKQKSESPEDDEEKPGDNPPEQKQREAKSRNEGKTFSGRGKELRK